MSYNQKQIYPQSPCLRVTLTEILLKREAPLKLCLSVCWIQWPQPIKSIEFQMAVEEKTLEIRKEEERERDQHF